MGRCDSGGDQKGGGEMTKMKVHYSKFPLIDAYYALCGLGGFVPKSDVRDEVTCKTCLKILENRDV